MLCLRWFWTHQTNLPESRQASRPSCGSGCRCGEQREGSRCRCYFGRWGIRTPDGEAFSAPGDLPEIPALVASKDWWRLLRRWPGRVIFPLYRRQRRARTRWACRLCLLPIRFVLKNKSSLTKLRATQLLTTRIIKVKIIFNLKNLWI